jgi:hypothetical protein
VVCRTKLALTVEPAVNDVVAVPEVVVVCAVVDIVVWLGTALPPVEVVTVRYVVPTLLLLSVAVTETLPDKLGTVTYAMNDPAVAVTVAGVVIMSCPFTWITIVEPAVNPLPRICTVLPTEAVVGLTESVGVVRLNDALAELPAASVTTTVFVAAAVIGIANVVRAETAPVPVVVAVARVTAAPLTVAVSVLDAAKPVPDTVIVAPFMPKVGVTAIVGVILIEPCTDRPVFESVRVSR